jgi:hypothetical protein
MMAAGEGGGEGECERECVREREREVREREREKESKRRVPGGTEDIYTPGFTTIGGSKRRQEPPTKNVDIQ